MRSLFLVTIVAGGLLAMPGATVAIADDAGAYWRAEPVERDGFTHGPWRSGDALLAGQPDPDAVRALAADGYELVINLRIPEEMEELDFDASSVVEEAGMIYVNIPLRGSDAHPFTPAAVDTLADVLDRHDGPFLLHCASSFRAGQLWGAYLVRHRGVDINTAFSLARDTGLRMPLEEFLDTRLEVREPQSESDTASAR